MNVIVYLQMGRLFVISLGGFGCVAVAIYRSEHMQDGINVPALRRGIPDQDTQRQSAVQCLRLVTYTKIDRLTLKTKKKLGFLHMTRFRMVSQSSLVYHCTKDCAHEY